MKSLNKKIIAVVLMSALCLPFLSQGLETHAILNLSGSKKIVVSYNEFQDIKTVEENEGNPDYGNYDAVYLGNETRTVYKSYSDKWDFLKKAAKDLKLKSWKEEHVFIKVGKSYFKIYFNLTDHQRKMLLIRDIGEHYGFKVLHAHGNYFWGGTHEFDSHLQNRDDFKDKPDVVNRLVQGPTLEFPSLQGFIEKLVGGLGLPKGYSRLRAGDYDYLIFKES